MMITKIFRKWSLGVKRRQLNFEIVQFISLGRGCGGNPVYKIEPENGLDLDSQWLIIMSHCRFTSPFWSLFIWSDHLASSFIIWQRIWIFKKVKWGTMRSYEVKSGQMKSYEVKWSHMRSNDLKLGQTRSNEVHRGQFGVKSLPISTGIEKSLLNSVSNWRNRACSFRICFFA